MDFDPAEQEAELGQLTIWSERRLGRTHIMCGHRNIKLVLAKVFVYLIHLFEVLCQVYVKTAA
jgi:hypothetical protein